jgi:hypothetical protein
MKLIIVDRSKPATFKRLTDLFADDINVEVMLERRQRQRRQKPDPRGPERRSTDRRRLTKPWNGKDYIVIQIANKR